ncbi:YtxH domain-containing protein [Lacinutrix sp. MEBiC02595]
MADEKNLSDDLEDMIGDVKEGAKKAAHKASDFAEDAKEKASDFAEDAKEVLSDSKNVAIIAHLTIIGWVIALVMNNGEKKSEYGSFYIRQVLGLGLCLLLLGFIPLVGWILSLVLVILWVMSLIGALSGEKKLTPILGEYFQDWFKSL